LLWVEIVRTNRGDETSSPFYRQTLVTGSSWPNEDLPKMIKIISIFYKESKHHSYHKQISL